ncbi:metal-dependent hydrolase [Desulfurococcaceae archaeon MEX13E-LK6-19]|nr:metal-dependent hydrolase [Desulfurococcaceae archaeon MEX13E-LK6-19]
MPEPLIHGVVGLVVSRWLGVRRWWLLFLVVLFSVLPDVDAVFRIHRSFTHSLLVALVVGLAVVWLAWRTGRKSAAWVVGVFVLAYSVHVVMDLFTGPTPVLWPLVWKDFYVEVMVTANNTVSNGITLEPVLRVHVTDFTMEPGDIVDAPVATPTGVSIAVIVLALLLLEEPRIKRVLDKVSASIRGK